MEKKTIDENRDTIKRNFLELKVNEEYTTEFGIFKKTGEKEITMTMWIELPRNNTKGCIEMVKDIAESLGWRFIKSPSMKYAGTVW